MTIAPKTSFFPRHGNYCRTCTHAVADELLSQNTFFTPTSNLVKLSVFVATASKSGAITNVLPVISQSLRV